MKRFAAFYILVSSIFSFSHAQHPILYGTSTSGNGGIFRYTEQDNELKNVYRFKNSGIFSESQMVVGNDGIIYGVAEGGPYGDGIIYSLNPVTNQYTIRKNFHFPNGDRPNSPLVQGKDGKFYGTTLEVLYSFDPATSEYNEIFHFTEYEIYNARALTIASDGLLYGIVTPFNGEDPDFLFSFDLVNNTFQNLGVTGFSHFSSSLIEGTAGTLYGLTAGYLYSYSLSSKQFTKLFQFNSEIEGNRSLTLASDGKLYSTNTYGGATNHGTIFCFDPKRNSMKVIHDFDGQKGEYSRGGLVEGEDGKLYGMCLKTVPTPFNAEVVGSIYFSIDKDGNNYKIFRDFDHTGTFGEIGEGNFVLANHKLYGTAVAERTNPFEYIFSYSGSQDLFQQVIRTNQEKGFNPSGSMVQARDGRLYGVTNGGGSYGLGGIFSFNPGSGLYTMLFSFSKERGYNTIDDRNNYNPKNELVEAGNGKFYGVTSTGGPEKNGVIFSYDPNNSRYVVEKSFKPGARPSTGFTVATDGNLYSTLEIEKSEVEFEYQIFAFNPITRNYKVITRRSGRDNFTQLPDGKMYASVGGGIEIFDPATNKVEYSFPDSDQPEFYSQKLIEGADHKLYGISTSAGSDLYGMIFSFDPSDRTFEDLFYFDGTNGFWPVCVLLAASDGKLYGTASKGGNDNLGTLFSFDPLTKSFQLLQHFDVRTGGNPGGQGNSAFQSYGASRLVELNTSTPSIVSITDKKLYEGETAVLTVSLNRISMEPVKLNFRTVPGTATDFGKNPDFTPVFGEITIPPGEISTTVSVSLLEDELLETRETFTLVLQKANEALFQLGDSVGVINIKNGMTPVIAPGGEIITIPAITGSATETVVKDELLIRASPNPSPEFFTLYIGNKTDRLSVTVTNLSGQIMDKFDGAVKNSQLVFGHRYPAGSYFVRVVDGLKAKVITLVKTRK